MINLIPNEEKKKMSKDFYFRLITVFFVMLSISLLIASVAILPTYFLFSAEEDSINTKLEFQKSESIPLLDQDTLIVIKDLGNKLDLIENTQKNEFVFSQKVINEIILKKIPSIKITEISFQNNPQTGRKINISGKAPSREILLSFRRALEDDAAFSKVDLPISNFVKGSNIEFYLSLIPS
jgi:Tfp pilus assembly protein PilN